MNNHKYDEYSFFGYIHEISLFFSLFTFVISFLILEFLRLKYLRNINISIIKFLMLFSIIMSIIIYIKTFIKLLFMFEIANCILEKYSFTVGEKN